jgi:transcriptional regulator with XRE-family HTH domain
MSPSRAGALPADPQPGNDRPQGTDEAALDGLGERVAQARRRADLTLATVAQRAEVSAGYVSQIESSSANPTVRSLARVATAIGTSLGELLGAGTTSPRFEPRFATTPRAATAPGVEGIWDLTALGAGRLAARLVRGPGGDHAEPVTHPGEEFLTVLAGRCTLHVGGLARDLRAFDGCHLAATDPHHIDNASDDLLLLVVLAP